MPTSEHHATAADYLKKIRGAQAKGDLQGAAALKKAAVKFMSTVPGDGPPAGLPPQDENCVNDR
jgi:hypothetical protein